MPGKDSRSCRTLFCQEAIGIDPGQLINPTSWRFHEPLAIIGLVFISGGPPRLTATRCKSVSTPVYDDLLASLPTMISHRAARLALRSNVPYSTKGRLVTAIPLPRYYAQVAATQDIRPPVALFGLDGTYASALVRLCSLLLTKSAPDVLLESIS